MIMNRVEYIVGNCVLVLFFAVIFAIGGASRALAEENQCAIASAHPLATAAGCEILSQGGNAFDGAVAVTAALAVVEPFSSGLGGGGFYLLHRARDGFEIFVDARETAPAQADASKFLDAKEKPVAAMTRSGTTAAGIPGIPAALQRIATEYGRLSFEQTFAPAIRYAEQGYPADARYARASGWMVKTLAKDPRAAAIFLDEGKAAESGFMVHQPQLGATLRRIVSDGVRTFYHGQIGREMVQSVRSSGGFWTMQDLAAYRVIEREPQRIEFRGARITTAPLPSSGGLVMAQTLQILDTFPLQTMREDARVHTIVEAMRRAYNDRARYMGDADFVDVPVEMLGSAAYARERAQGIDALRATPSSELPSVYDAVEEGKDTTHFSIIDSDGNRVAATLSINGPFGAGVVAGNTGVLLNNHMDDFAIAPNSPNMYKLVGNFANGIEAGKRPLSSMSPTFVEDSRGVLVLGTPGGSRIISMVMLGVIEYMLSDDIDAVSIVGSPRYHHQYLPDRIQVEPGGFNDEWIAALRAKGHEVEIYRRKWGNMQAVFQHGETGKREVANDPRGRAGVVF
jgi:gamma-glutamyltranspeptidase/glutathione hydrolase